MWYIVVLLSAFYIGHCIFEGLTNIAKVVDNISEAIIKLINNNNE